MIETEIRTQLNILSTIGNAKIHFNTAPQGTVPPYMILSQISGNEDSTHDGVDGCKEGRFQVSIFSTTYSQATQFLYEIEQLVNYKSSNVAAIFYGSRIPDQYENDAKLFQRGRDFIVQYKEV
jgi:hypothetical protein